MSEYLESSETILARQDVESGRAPKTGLVHHHAGWRFQLMTTTCGLELETGPENATHIGRYAETNCPACLEIIEKRGW